MSSAVGCTSWQTMLTVRISVVPSGPPTTRRHVGQSSAATAPQVTASIHDFAVSRGSLQRFYPSATCYKRSPLEAQSLVMRAQEALESIDRHDPPGHIQCEYVA